MGPLIQDKLHENVTWAGNNQSGQDEFLNFITFHVKENNCVHDQNTSEL